MLCYKKVILILIITLLLFLFGLVIPEWTATIQNAALQGDLARIKKLLAKDPGLANARNENGITPLHYAAYSGHRDAARLLIEKKTEMNARENISGWTPLCLASMSGHRDIAELQDCGNPLKEKSNEIKKTSPRAGKRTNGIF